ncbi:hypothetical protein BDY19DRAFT_919407 [Irpex rosettiformis]|uniref:Uncharacterized protein n=1 Tax=Irpex rosettiformis TaxID=378272 RepID=A0ACB8UHF4_9APHY|nr:hypothetical protein BDY19DRAFT_919407 [Irpex rosettiformis]
MHSPDTDVAEQPAMLELQQKYDRRTNIHPNLPLGRLTLTISYIPDGQRRTWEEKRKLRARCLPPYSGTVFDSVEIQVDEHRTKSRAL